MSASPRTIDTSQVSGQAPDGMRRIDKVVEQAALVMMPTGLIFIVLGWVGASRTPLLFEQIPYLISGGLLGLGLMIGGGLLYVGGWIARTAQLIPAAAPTENLASLLQAAGSTPTAASIGSYVRTPSGSMFHTADCAIVASRDDVVAVTSSEAEGYRPCGMCDPLAV